MFQSVLLKFQNTSLALDRFFATLQRWGQVLTHDFANLYKAKSEAEAQVILIIDKLNKLAKEKKALEEANEKIDRQAKDGVSLEQ